MSPNGALMAYSTPVDIKDLRDQAALVSMAWKDSEASLLVKRSKGANGSESSKSTSRQGLETLTIEFQHNNIIVRAIQPKLLLVLVGGVPPNRNNIFKITPEAYGDPRYPSAEPLPEEEQTSVQGDPSTDNQQLIEAESDHLKPKAASICSTMSQRDKDLKLGVLHIQRKKIDALTKFIRADFEAKGFVMPDDSSIT